MNTLLRIAEATAEPITLDVAKAHLRVTASSTDAEIFAYLLAAREAAETYMQRKIMPQTWEIVRDSFPAMFELPFGKVTAVSSIKYISDASVPTELTVTASTYETDLDSEPARVLPANGETWPSPDITLNAVRLRFIVGYATANDVPKAVTAGILLMLSWLWEQRSTYITGTIIAENPAATRLLFAHKVFGL